jgi:7-cyano-7-deazaguanine synthase
MKNKKYAVIALSGGMDSSTLLIKLLSEKYQVVALSFDYGQKHKVELERATELVEYINSLLWKKGYGLSYQVKHQIIKLDGLAQLLNSSLVEGGTEVPEGHYAEENMKDTVVPNRNKIFSSIIQAVALSIAEKNQSECVIAMGIHAGDFSVYPDCRPEFRDIDFEAFKAGNWGSERVNVYTPYIDVMKGDILKDGLDCCIKLGLNFDEVYKRTNTSYKPMIHDSIWYSDYKSASSVERIEAFIKLGRPDPTPYADENGSVSWDTVVEHVSKVLSDHLENQN